MDKNRSHGKIDRLPQPLKREVENKLLAGETYENISDYLKENGRDICKSSVGRYGQSFLKKFESVRVAKEFAKLLAEDNIDRPATELHEANNLLASEIIMEALVDDEMDSKARAEAARSVASLQRAQVANEKLKINARKEQGAVHTAFRLFADKVYTEIGNKYPDVARKLLELAEETEAEMNRMQ